MTEMRAKNDHEREAVLYAFQNACPRPSAGDIADWTGRHPDLADEIRERAELMLELAQRGPETVEPSAALLDRGRERALAALAAARAGPKGPAEAPTGFAGLLEAAGTSIPQLSRELDLGRPTLTDLVQGRMTAPVPKRLARALAGPLALTEDAVAGAAKLAAGSPQMGHAKAYGSPAATPRSFAEIVRDDPTMTPERKAFWLAADED